MKTWPAPGMQSDDNLEYIREILAESVLCDNKYYIPSLPIKCWRIA